MHSYACIVLIAKKYTTTFTHTHICGKPQFLWTHKYHTPCILNFNDLCTNMDIHRCLQAFTYAWTPIYHPCNPIHPCVNFGGGVTPHREGFTLLQTAPCTRLATRVNADELVGITRVIHFICQLQLQYECIQRAWYSNRSTTTNQFHSMEASITGNPRQVKCYCQPQS